MHAPEANVGGWSLQEVVIPQLQGKDEQLLAINGWVKLLGLLPGFVVLPEQCCPG